MAADARAYPLPDAETRRRRYYEDRAAEREDTVVRALLTVAARTTAVEFAAVGAERRNADEDEAERIAADHGFSRDRMAAFRGLARSRGVELEVVLRAALRGELRSIVERGEVRRDA